jgi:hypothetical protein
MKNSDRGLGKAGAFISNLLYYAFIGLALIYCLSNFPFEQVVYVYQQY